MNMNSSQSPGSKKCNSVNQTIMNIRQYHVEPQANMPQNVYDGQNAQQVFANNLFDNEFIRDQNAQTGNSTLSGQISSPNNMLSNSEITGNAVSQPNSSHIRNQNAVIHKYSMRDANNMANRTVKIADQSNQDVDSLVNVATVPLFNRNDERQYVQTNESFQMMNYEQHRNVFNIHSTQQQMNNSSINLKFNRKSQSNLDRIQSCSQQYLNNDNSQSKRGDMIIYNPNFIEQSKRLPRQIQSGQVHKMNKRNPRATSSGSIKRMESIEGKRLEINQSNIHSNMDSEIINSRNSKKSFRNNTSQHSFGAKHRSSKRLSENEFLKPNTKKFSSRRSANPNSMNCYKSNHVEFQMQHANHAQLALDKYRGGGGNEINSAKDSSQQTTYNQTIYSTNYLGPLRTPMQEIPEGKKIYSGNILKVSNKAVKTRPTTAKYRNENIRMYGPIFQENQASQLGWTSTKQIQQSDCNILDRTRQSMGVLSFSQSSNFNQNKESHPPTSKNISAQQQQFSLSKSSSVQRNINKNRYNQRPIVTATSKFQTNSNKIIERENEVDDLDTLEQLQVNLLGSIKRRTKDWEEEQSNPKFQKVPSGNLQHRRVVSKTSNRRKKFRPNTAQRQAAALLNETSASLRISSMSQIGVKMQTAKQGQNINTNTTQRLNQNANLKNVSFQTDSFDLYKTQQSQGGQQQNRQSQAANGTMAMNKTLTGFYASNSPLDDYYNNKQVFLKKKDASCSPYRSSISPKRAGSRTGSREHRQPQSNIMRSNEKKRPTSSSRRFMKIENHDNNEEYETPRHQSGIITLTKNQEISGHINTEPLKLEPLEDTEFDYNQLVKMKPHQKEEFFNNYEIGNMSFCTKNINKKVNSHIKNLTQAEEMAGRDPQFHKINKLDCEKIFDDASKKIKIIKYQCNTTVAAEDQRVINLKTPNKEDGAMKGPENDIDLIENCPLLCKVSVRNMKAPLKIHINYKNNNQFREPRAARKRPQSQTFDGREKNNKEPANPIIIKSKLHDLKIFTSDNSNNPNEKNSIQTFINPGSKFIITNPKTGQKSDESKGTKAVQHLDEREKKMKNKDDCFQNRYIYLCFMSTVSCSLDLSCQFPNNATKEEKKGRDGTIVQYQSRKDMRKNINDVIQKQILELEGDLYNQRKLAAHISKLKSKRHRAGIKNSEKNFINDNIESTTDPILLRERQMMLRYIQQDRNDEARLRREQILEDRMEKIKHDMVKWDLYRIEREQKKDEYSALMFSKNRVKIWADIILRHMLFSDIFNKFDKKREQVLLELRKKEIMRKIRRSYQRHIRKFGSNIDHRDRGTIRKRLTFTGPILINGSKAIARQSLYSFIKDTAELKAMYDRFQNFWVQTEKIKKRIKMIPMYRHLRRVMVSLHFDREREIMIKYYKKKMSKFKKYKSTYKALKDMTQGNRQVVLENYHQNKTVNENMRAVIIDKAQKQFARGERKENRFTDQEHQWLMELQKAIQITNDFLNKGVKDQQAVGSLDNQDLKLNEKVDKPLKQSDSRMIGQGDGVVDGKNIDNQEHTGGLISPSVDQASDADDNSQDGTVKQVITVEKVEQQKPNSVIIQPDTKKGGKDKKRRQSSAKTTSKSKSVSRSSGPKKSHDSKTNVRDSTVSPVREPSPVRKSKKKKNKEIEVFVPFDIPKEQQRLNQLLPTRAGMQKLVMRAALLKKDKDVEPKLEEIRPWIIKFSRPSPIPNADII